MVIGLTGGIGCGKSAAAAYFAEFGYNIVDADRLARQVLESDDCTRSLRARWGEACLGPDGRPDRRWIAAKVFGDPAELVFLEGLTHPEVARLRQRAVIDASRHHVVEIPLLFEKNLTEGFAFIVCVACSEGVNSQMTLAEKVKRSDVVLWNDGEPSFLREQVASLVGRISAH